MTADLVDVALGFNVIVVVGIKSVDVVVERAASAVQSVLLEGIDVAMQDFNGFPKDEKIIKK